jgi:hypothetical protein
VPHALATVDGKFDASIQRSGGEHQDILAKVQLGFIEDDPPARSAMPFIERARRGTRL